MIEQDLKAYLDKADIYIINSIECIEQASRFYGQYIDSSGFKPDLAIMVKELYINIGKIYYDITDYVINDLAPDPYQDLDLSIHTFISTCHNCIFFLTKLAEREEVHHWLIKKNFEDCQKEYKKLFNNRKLPDICASSSYYLPVALKIDPDSRILLSIYQRLDESKIT